MKEESPYYTSRKGSQNMQTFITQQHKDEAVESLKTLIAYPSVLDEEPKDGTPFGQGIQDALEGALELCKRLGMETYIDPDGYYGYAEYGSGEETLAILCHMDVVPAGNEADWDTPPFEAVVKGDSIYGRGTQDDKGPSVAALYALKAVIDSGANFERRIRFIFGTDEENLWRGLDQYNKKEKPATMGFSPDSVFPLTYAEKGLLQVKLHGPKSNQVQVQAGGALNVVPDQAIYSGEYADELQKQLDQQGFEYEKNDDHIRVKGKAIHSKDAPQGTNAVSRLAIGLSSVVSEPALNFIAKEIGEDAKGTQLFGEIHDEDSGSLTFNVAQLKINEDSSEIGIDIRIPVSADKDEIVKSLKTAAAKYHLDYEEFDYLASLYVPKDSDLVQTLLAVYREKTGDQAEPMSSGGATFARTMKNCVAFGAMFPDTQDTMHMPNENMPLKDIYRSMDIFAEAIYRLACQS